jgi:hypothetical protein
MITVTEALTMLSPRRAKKLERLVDQIFSPAPCYNVRQQLNEIVSRTPPDINAAVRELVENLTFNAKSLTKNYPSLTAQRH